MSTRRALLAIALAFAIFEIVDIPDTGAPAAVFAALFLAGAVWIWRRPARVPVVLVGLLLAVEATQAQTWKDASLAARDFAMVVGSIGLVVVGAHLAASKHAKLAGALAAAVTVVAALAGAA